MTGPPIPDAPRLPPWVKAYAEYDGQRIALVDHVEAGCYGSEYSKRFSVSTLSDPCHTAMLIFPCTREIGFELGPGHRYTNDYAEALAVFARERDRLAEEG